MSSLIWENKYIPWKDAQIGGRYFDKYLFTADQMREAIRRAVDDTRLEYDKKVPTVGSNISGSGILSFDGAVDNVLDKLYDVKFTGRSIKAEEFLLSNVFEDEAFKVPRAPRLVGESIGGAFAMADEPLNAKVIMGCKVNIRK